jgi:hypothetical protein
MILGLSISAFTTVHVVVSLLGILAGLVWLWALLRDRWAPRWNAGFLSLTFAATVSGFLFPISVLTPALIVGGVSLAALLLAAAALLVFARRGVWHNIYAGSAVFALYLNAFVAVVQAFQKLSVLNRLAPTGTEPAFMASQAALILAFAIAGFVAVRSKSALLAECA